MKQSIFFLLVALFFTGAVEASDSLFQNTDYEKLLVESRQLNQPILLFFTGSDWCIWCKRLDQEVFQKEEFVRATYGNILFLEVDFPMNKELSPELEKQNEILKKKYSISKYPTVVLIDGDEKILGVTGYQSGGPSNYVASLQKILGDLVTLK